MEIFAYQPLHINNTEFSYYKNDNSRFLIDLYYFDSIFNNLKEITSISKVHLPKVYFFNKSWYSIEINGFEYYEDIHTYPGYFELIINEA